MIFKPMQWFRQLQVRSKILLGVSSIVVLGMILSIILYTALSVSSNALDKVANEEEPTSAAAYEMEFNVVKSGLKVLNYLRTGNLDYRSDALKDKGDFDYFLSQYNTLANSEAEKQFGLQVGSLYAQYWDLGEQLMDRRAMQEVSFTISLEQLALTEASLEKSLSLIKGRSASTNARRKLLVQMKQSLDEMGKALGVYLRLGQISSMVDLADESEQFLVQLSYYQAMTQDRSEKEQAEKMATLFNTVDAAIQDAFHFYDQTEQNLANFTDLRIKLDNLLAERMLPAAKADLESAKVYAEKSAKDVKMDAAMIAPIILLFSLGVVYILTISVTQPAEQLVAGANAIGTGEMQYRIPDLGADELGQLGRQFNVMAERLEQTTVSKNSLEASEAALRVSEERYARAMSGTNDGMFDWDLISNKVYFSPRWISMLGYSENEITDDPESYFQFVHEDDIEVLRQSISLYFNRPGEYLVNEHRMLHKDGFYRWVMFRALATDETGSQRATRLSGSQTDIDAQKSAELQLVHDAMHDRLTGLPNRHLLLDRLQHYLDNPKRRERAMCGLLFMDLDGFKMVNDSLGHEAGDRLLVTLSDRLTNILGAADTIARFGGDEFVVLAEDVSEIEEVEEIAENIRQVLELPFETGNGKTFVGASMGIALSSPHYTLAEDMMRDADIAMYRAKSEGKGRHVIFDDKMHGNVLKRVKLESDLRLALEREEFVIYYQPIIDLQGSRKLVGFEALLRWNHPIRGIIPPDDFIPLLEENGMIVPVSEWILKTACKTVKKWHRKNYTPWVSVNVSAVQLREPGLVATVENALKVSGLQSEFLTLEITETNVMQNEELARTLLVEVKTLGVKLSIDDFGVGYSSLSYLKHFPWDYVKIDRSFVRDLATNTEDAAIIKAIIVMVHSLNFDVVAEGVENIEQLEFLQQHGIDCVQGYMLARPAHADAWDSLTSISSKKFLKNAFDRGSVSNIKSNVKRKIK